MLTWALINGQILTMRRRPRAEALAVKDGLIELIGDNEQILNWCRPDTEVIDLQGLTVIPGFVDTHNHIFDDAKRNDRVDWLLTAQDRALEMGITTMGDLFNEPHMIERLLSWENRLRIRTAAYLSYNDNHGAVPWGNTRWWYQDQSPIRDAHRMLRIIGVKVFIDGSSASRGDPAVSLCYKYEYINNESGRRGHLFLTEEQLTYIIRIAQYNGYQVAIHAVGDRAVETCLNSIESALQGRSNEEERHRIEHNCMIRDELLTRYGQMDIVATICGINFMSDCFLIGFPSNWWGKMLVDEYPETMRRWTLPNRSLLGRNPGLHAAWHSDMPRISRGPMADLWGFVTRKCYAGLGWDSNDNRICHPRPGFGDQGITVEQALKAMTIEGAYALFMEKHVGSLERGKFADIVILSDNPLSVAGLNPDRLKNIKVLVTVVGGRVEYFDANDRRISRFLSQQLSQFSRQP